MRLSRLAEQLLACDRLVGIEHGFELLPFDRDRGHRRARLLECVCADRGDRSPLVAALLFELRNVARADRRVDARQRERGREIDARDVCMRVRAAQHGCVQHPRQLEIGGVDRLASRTLESVDTRRRLSDDLACAGGPLLQCVLFDDEPDLLVTGPRLPSRCESVLPCANRLLDLRIRAAAAEVSRHCVADLFGRRRGFRPRPAPTALTICPGVQKPHCSASLRTNECTIGWSRSPSIVVTSRPSTACASVMHESVGIPSTSTVHAPQ